MDNKKTITTEERLATVARHLATLNEQKGLDFDAGVAAGKAQRDYEWWDYYQSVYVNGVRYSDRINYLYAFAGTGWDDTNYNPVRTITVARNGNAQQMYAYSNITDTKVAINLAHGGTTVNCYNAFANANKLITIRKLIVDEATRMDNQFTNCAALQNLIIEGTIAKNAYFQWCPLTKASILSVFAALSDTAAGVIAQFKTSAVNAAFETSEGANDGSTSAEWTALVTSKPNWTIALAEA